MSPLEGKTLPLMVLLTRTSGFDLCKLYSYIGDVRKNLLLKIVYETVEQQFSNFLMLSPFDTVPHVVVTPQT